MTLPAPIIVQKYGGSSLTDVAGIRAVAAQVVAARAQGYRVVVVVSAMGNTTNELLALARQVSPRPGRRELDLLVSVGERVSMTLLAMAIQDLGVPAASFTGSQSGIITDEQHVAAQVIEVRPQRIQQALDEGQVAIVAGFQGVSRTREVTTLGRGGSDTTAVVLAAALGAEFCELRSDVDGIYSADPRVVPGAVRIDELSLDAASELTGAGAKVVAAEAIEHARRLGVTLCATATTAPSGTGTRLAPGPVPDAVVAVTADAELSALLCDTPGQLASLAGATRAWIPQGERCFALVDRRNLHGQAMPAGVTDLGSVAAVTAVGRSVVTDPLTAQRARDAVVDLGGRLWWASGGHWSVVIDPGHANTAVRRLHERLIEA